MLFFLLNLRNFFYTRSIKNSDPRNFDYRISMSVLFMVYYMIFLALLDIILKRYANGFSIIKHIKSENFIEKILLSIATFTPLALGMFLMLKSLEKYELTRMNESEEQKWLFTTIGIFALGFFSLLFLPGLIAHLLK